MRDEGGRMNGFAPPRQLNRSAVVPGVEGMRSIWTAVCPCLVALGCSTAPHSPSFDTSYSAPAAWKLVEEGKWGLRFNIPPSLRDVGFVNSSLWVHEGQNLRVIVDFSPPSSLPESLRRKPNYSETRLRINGLSALVCSYDQSSNKGRRLLLGLCLYTF